MTVTGEELQYVTSVTFGEPGTFAQREATLLSVSSTAVTFVSPPGTGRVPVDLIDDVEEASAGEFTYRLPPTIKKLTPKKGSPAGGTGVTIVGSES